MKIDIRTFEALILHGFLALAALGLGSLVGSAIPGVDPQTGALVGVIAGLLLKMVQHELTLHPLPAGTALDASQYAAIVAEVVKLLGPALVGSAVALPPARALTPADGTESPISAAHRRISNVEDDLSSAVDSIHARLDMLFAHVGAREA